MQAASTLMDLSGAFVIVDLPETQIFAKVKNSIIIYNCLVVKEFSIIARTRMQKIYCDH
jgi:hypothetical protein